MKSGMLSVALQERKVVLDVCSAAGFSEECQDSNSISHVRSVRGTLHQGNGRFKYGGLQCVAGSLIALAKHITKSVFSW